MKWVLHVVSGLGLSWLIMLAAACGGGGSEEGANGGRLKVVATTVQAGALAKAVGGDLVSLTTLVGPGVDPHEFEPAPDDLKTIGKAKLVLRNGIGLDDWLDPIIANANGSASIVTITDGVRLRSAADSPNDKDPHVWHDPMNDKIMVDNIAAALAAVDSADAATFKANADVYKQRLDAVDAQIRAIIDTIPPASRKMVTDHDAFGYFIDRYGLQLIGAVIPSSSTQAEPSAKGIAELEDTIRREHVKAVFSEGTADPKVARQVASDTGARLVDTLYGDSLGEPGSGQETVDGMLLFNAKAIADALK